MLYKFTVEDLVKFEPKFADVKKIYTFNYDDSSKQMTIISTATNKVISGLSIEFYGFLPRTSILSDTKSKVKIATMDVINAVKFAAVEAKKHSTADETSKVSGDEYMICAKKSGANRVFFPKVYTKEEAAKQISSWSKTNPTVIYYLMKVESTSQYGVSSK